MVIPVGSDTTVVGPFDAIVVGSGPGGATVAEGLTERGWRVLVLEMGRHDEVTGGIAQTLRELWMPGRSLFLAGGSLAIVRGVTVGGSSVYFWGTASDPAYELFDRHGVDLRADVEETKQRLSIAPLPPELIGPAATRIRDSATALGYRWEALPKFFDQTQLGGPVLGSYGAPSYSAKWNARHVIEDALTGGATLLTQARVRRVLVEDGTAVGVEFIHRGNLRRATASTVILAAGGLGSPVVLRASGLDGAGQSMFCDPLVAVTGSLPGAAHGLELPMVGGALFEDDGYMLTDMSVPAWVHAMMHTQVGRLDRIPSYRHSAAIMVKIRDDMHGHITRRGGVRKRLTGSDRQRLDRGARRARAILERAGARHLTRTLPFAAHPGGTVAVGQLLDSDLQTQISGLYVCDASVIADPWGLPPTLTLVALGRRLARHLAAARTRDVESDAAVKTAGSR